MMGVGTQLRNGEFRMRATKNEKIIYKMYKKGRFWVFAGIAVTTWNVNLLNGQADTVDETSATSSVTSSSATQLSGSTTTLSRSDVTTATSDNSQTATTKADQTTTDDQASSTTKADDTTSEINETSESSVTASDSKTTNQTTTNETSSQKETTQSHQTATDQDKTSTSQSNKTVTVDESSSSTTTAKDADTTTSTSTNQVTESTSTVTQPTAETTQDTTAPTADVVDAETNVTAAETTDTLTTAPLTTTNTTAINALSGAMQAAVVQGSLSKKMLARAATVTATVVASGDFSKEVTGGSTWTLDSNGLLTISAGTWGAMQGANSWYSNRAKIKSVVIEGPVTAGSSLAYTFFGAANLTSISGLNYIDTSHVTDMDRMFSGAKISDFSGIANWDTSKVTDMGGMFSSNLATTIPVAGWNVSNVTAFDTMFSNNVNLTSLDLSGWTLNATKNITMGGMFMTDTSLTSLNLSGWQTANVISIANLFASDSSLTTLNLTGWQLTKATSWMNVFRNTASLKTVDLSGWKSDNVTNFTNTFSNTGILGSLNLAQFQTGEATTMAGMFAGTDLTGIDLSSLTTSAVTDMSSMFAGATLAGIDLSTFDTSQVTDMSSMFQNTNLAGVNLSKLDTSAVQLMASMFSGTQGLESLDLSHFKTNNVTSMNSMFSDTSIKQLNLSSFDTSQVTDMYAMFSGAAVTSLDLSSFDMTNVASMTDMLKATSLSTLTLSPTVNLQTSGVNIFGDPYQDTVTLPAIKVTDQYTGSWIDTDGKTYTSAELMAAYDQGRTTNFTAPITYTWEVITSKSDLTAKNITLIAGPKTTWTAKDSVASLKDVDGNAIDLSTVSTDVITATGDTVETTKAGTYQVILAYTDDKGVTRTADATVTIVNSQAVLVGQTVSVNQGSKTWQASDSVDQTKSLNADGQALDVTELASVTSSTLDTSKAGAQTVTLTYVDAAGNTVTTDVVVNVIASQAGLVTKNIEIVKGQNATWNVLDNVISATDFNGDAVTDLKTLQLTTSTTPDLTTVGDYPMTLTYTDGEGNAHTYTISVKVIASQVNLAGKDVTVIMGPNANWQVSDSLASATGSDGHALTAAELAKVTTNATPDLTKVGDTEVTLTYTDAAGNTATTTATIHVIKSVAHVNVKDGTIIMGPNATWQAQDNLVSVIQANGDTVAADDVILKNDVQVNSARVMSIMYSYLRADGTTVTVSGQVDLSKIGDNTITYTYTDSQGNTTNSVANVAVVASQAALNANDQTIVQGPNASWNATKAVTVTDEFGQSTAATTVTVGGDTVDLTKAGVYHVTYTYTDGAGNVFTKTIAVTVAATQAGLTTTNSTLIAGPTTKWTVMDNLTAGKDATGQALDLSQVKVSGTVDTTKVGSYPITYTYTDNQGNVVKQTITVTVTKSQAGLTVKDSTLTAGGTWTAADNFVQATDATGQTLTLSAVTVSGQVNTTTAGSYQVTYTYVDAAGNTYTKTAAITVQPATDTDDNGGTTTNSDGDGDTVNPGDDGTTVNPDGDGDTINPGTDENTLVNPDGDGDTINPGTTASHGANQQPTVLAKTTVVSAAVVTANKKKVAQLPQTDEDQTHNVSALGLTLLALTGVVSWFEIGRKRRHN